MSNFAAEGFSRISRRPARTVLVDARLSIAGFRYRSRSFAELDADSDRFAAYLRSLGIEKGSRVLLLEPMRYRLYVAVTSLLKMGAVAIFVDPSLRRRSFTSAIEEANPAIMVTNRVLLPVLRLRPSLLRLPVALVGKYRIRGSGSALAEIDPSDPAMITYTSGTTGKPKCVQRSYQFIETQRETLSSYLAIREGAVELTGLPVFVLNNIASGIASVLPATVLGRWHPRAVVNQLRSLGITRCFASPGPLLRFSGNCERHGIMFSNVTDVFTGGAPLGVPFLQSMERLFPGATIHLLYGSTEAEPIAVTTNQAFTKAIVDRMARGGGYYVGKPVPEICVLVDTAGEILVTGAHVNLASGPDGEHRSSTQVDAKGIAWHRTGDTGYLDQEGHLWLTGRVGSDPGTYRLETIVEQLEWAARGAACVLILNGVKYTGVFVLERRGSLVRRTARREEVFQRCRDAGVGVDMVRIVRRLPVDRRHHYRVRYDMLRQRLRRAVRPRRNAMQGS